MTDSRLQETLWAQAPPRVTVELLFLGCLILREALQPCDFVRMVAMSQLPFLNFAKTAAPVLATAEVQLPSRVLRPKAIQTVNTLLHNTARLASLLGVCLPGVNAGGLLFRFVTELQLPQVGHESNLSWGCQLPVLSLPLCSLPTTFCQRLMALEFFAGTCRSCHGCGPGKYDAFCSD
mmetsp:Transcript_24586/g.68430  ORF Transcript_24586/g.68430 Transcript_24586/m.68430 type:complete len:178 (+) Transcript_24586:706-1239(+)